MKGTGGKKLSLNNLVYCIRCFMPVVSAPNFKSRDNIPFSLQITARKYNNILLFNLIDYLIPTQLIPKTSNPKFD